MTDENRRSYEWWMRRYADLLHEVEQWAEENHGEEARDHLVSHLGVEGWLNMSSDWLRVVREYPRAYEGQS